MKSIFSILFLIACALRFFELGRFSLWLDEYTSIEVSTKSLLGVLTGEGFDRHTPPFYYLVLHGWFSLLRPLGFLPNEATLRLPSVLFDIGTLFLLYAWSNGRFGRKVAQLTTLLYGYLGFPLYFAQEGRMYSLLAFLCVATLLLRDRIQRRPRSSARILLPIIALCGLYTHYYYFFFLVGLGSSLLPGVFRRERTALVLVGLFAVAGIGFLPWIGVLLSIAAGGGQSFRPLSLFSIPYAVFRILAGYSIFPLDSAAKLDYGASVRANLPLLGALTALSGGFLLLGLLGLLKRGREHSAPILSILVASTLLPLLISLKVPMFSERYLSGIFPLVALLFALALISWGRWVQWGGGILLVGTMLASTLTYFGAEPRFGKEQWRDVAAFLRAQELTEPVVIDPHFTRGLLEHYCPECRVLSFEEWQGEDAVLVRRGTGQDRAPEQISLIPLRTFPLESGISLYRLRGSAGQFER